MYKDAELAHWFVEEFCGDPWIHSIHDKQIYAARDLLKTHTAQQIKDTILCASQGKLRSTDFQPMLIGSLAFLLYKKGMGKKRQSLVEEALALLKTRRLSSSAQELFLQRETQAFMCS